MSITAADWGRRVQVTGDAPAGTLSGFTALITGANLPTEIWNTAVNGALNGGGDLRVCLNSDGTSQLPLEVVDFTITSSTSGTAQLWVRFPTYSSGARECWLFYGKAGETQPGVATTYGRNNVWQDFTHALGGNGQTDVTGNASTTLNGSAAQSGTVNGFNAITTTGTVANGDCLSFDSTSGENWTGNLTLSAWINLTSNGVDFAQVIGIRTGNDWEFSYRIEGNQPAMLVGSSSPNSTSALSTGTDYFLTATISGSTISFYVDGAVVNTQTVSGSRTNRTANLEVNGISDTNGSNVTLNGKTANANAINGAVKSANHISAEYSNQNDPSAFWATGTPQNTNGGGGIVIAVIMNHLRNQGIA